MTIELEEIQKGVEEAGGEVIETYQQALQAVMRVLLFLALKGEEEAAKIGMLLGDAVVVLIDRQDDAKLR